MAWNVNEFFNSDIEELKRMKERFNSDIDQVIEYKEQEKGGNNDTYKKENAKAT